MNVLRGGFLKNRVYVKVDKFLCYELLSGRSLFFSPTVSLGLAVCVGGEGRGIPFPSLHVVVLAPRPYSSSLSRLFVSMWWPKLNTLGCEFDKCAQAAHASVLAQDCISPSFLCAHWRVSLTCVPSLVFKRIFVIFIPAFVCIELQTESSCCQTWNAKKNFKSIIVPVVIYSAAALGYTTHFLNIHLCSGTDLENWCYGYDHSTGF